MDPTALPQPSLRSLELLPSPEGSPLKSSSSVESFQRIPSSLSDSMILTGGESVSTDTSTQPPHTPHNFPLELASPDLLQKSLSINYSLWKPGDTCECESLLPLCTHRNTVKEWAVSRTTCGNYDWICVSPNSQEGTNVSEPLLNSCNTTLGLDHAQGTLEPISSTQPLNHFNYDHDHNNNNNNSKGDKDNDLFPLPDHVATSL
ncbi:hypothetical protein FA15DRAFT_711506 [Coprinopsis marcescibilis]|uniref:Uncharacterized protein n=1 Tax=Coprinopsis marcescibilis TaxID=230819 RepID=A0A5C3KAN8_COPMA|nr:hypothetical protein FA15DRAFT_711506 [Coprinopsis marcescibilis]